MYGLLEGLNFEEHHDWYFNSGAYFRSVVGGESCYPPNQRVLADNLGITEQMVKNYRYKIYVKKELKIDSNLHCDTTDRYMRKASETMLIPNHPNISQCE